MKEIFSIIRRSLFCKLISTFLCITFFIGPEALAYTVSEKTIDGIQEFDAFLARCSAEERISLLQALGAFDKKIDDDLFGKIGDLKSLDNYAKNEKEAKENSLPLRPTYNNVSAATVLEAINKGYVSFDYSQKKIKKELLWRRYNKLNYIWYSTNNIDYHRDIVRWIANKKDVKKNLIMNDSTFDLERAVIKKYFEQIWDKLSPEQRQKLLEKIEAETGKSLGDKTAIAALSGSAALAILSTTAAFAGFAFYTTVSVIICTVAGWLGVTLPFSVYIATSTTLSVLTGPIGWAIAGIAAVGGGIYLARSQPDVIFAFVMQVNAIKTSWLYKK